MKVKLKPGIARAHHYSESDWPAESVGTVLSEGSDGALRIFWPHRSATSIWFRTDVEEVQPQKPARKTPKKTETRESAKVNAYYAVEQGRLMMFTPEQWLDWVEYRSNSGSHRESTDFGAKDLGPCPDTTTWFVNSWVRELARLKEPK
jgi:hypothetical protein